MIKPTAILVTFLISFGGVYAQQNGNEPPISTTDLIILFATAVFVILGVVLYITRELILRKKTDYDKEDLLSKKNRDYEKYHSDWTDDYVEFGKRSSRNYSDLQEEFESEKLPNYYEILGVSPNASQDEIKRKFRTLVKELHPDRSKDKNTESRLAEINKAYEVLSDKEMRKKYDSYFM